MNLKIRSIEIQQGAALAPMAGATDAVFRTICAEFGAVYTVSEMVSAKALSLGDKKSAALMQRPEGSAPYGIQLFGSDPAAMEKAAALAMAAGPDFIDINMGCPAPKITGTGAGSAVMRSPALAGELVAAAVAGCSVPVTVKIRKGFGEYLTAVEVAVAAEKNGAAAVAVHGRTREQMYMPGVDRAIIRQVKEAVSIPVIGNGDVVDGESARSMLAETGCDLVMVGRAALGAPWVFREIGAALRGEDVPPPPPVTERMRVMLRHIYGLCEQKGEPVAMREARTHAGWYMKGLRGAAALRREAVTMTRYTDAEALAHRAILENLGS